MLSPDSEGILNSCRQQLHCLLGSLLDYVRCFEKLKWVYTITKLSVSAYAPLSIFVEFEKYFKILICI
jgi:hypothetical protein